MGVSQNTFDDSADRRIPQIHRLIVRSNVRSITGLWRSADGPHRSHADAVEQTSGALTKRREQGLPLTGVLPHRARAAANDAVGEFTRTAGREVGRHGVAVSTELGDDAEAQQGAEFVVLLPALRAGTSEPPGAPKPTLRLRSARRVLVVDDNVDAAEMLLIALGREDREVAIAHDGLAALDLASTFMPDAVVIDIGLPVMDGYEVARRLRERERRDPTRQPARLIALTGYGQESDRARSASAGMDVHLVKPVALDELEAALARPAPAGDASRPS